MCLILTSTCVKIHILEILLSSTENNLLLAISVQLIENIFFVASDNLTKDWICSVTAVVHFTGSPRVKVPFTFWSLDGVLLDCRQKYFNTVN